MNRYEVDRAVRKAIYEGKLHIARGQKCAHCGEPAVDLHHYNGYAPEHVLDVIPLCRKCHRAAHAEMRFVRKTKSDDDLTRPKERSVRFLLTDDQYRKLQAIQRHTMRETLSDTLRFLIEKEAQSVRSNVVTIQS